MKSKPATDANGALGTIPSGTKSAADTKPRDKRRGPTPTPGTRDANKLAVAILDVLAGARLPSQAAEALGISLPRYYQLEQRALDAIVQACEPRPKGPPRNPERQAAHLERQIGRLTQELSRQQALVRAAQRTIGLAPPAPSSAKGSSAKPAAGAAKSKSRRRRRPTVRALKAAQRLREAVATDVESAAVSSPAPAPPSESSSHVNLPPAVPAAHSL